MYAAIDVGGTKTLVALITNDGKIVQKIRFETPKTYEAFLHQLATHIESLQTTDVRAVAIALPGRVDREHGIGIALGNRPWKNIPIRADLEKYFKAPVLVDNDANLAGLSEAKLVKNKFQKVLYVTISTGIGIGVISNGIIDPEFADSEGGRILLEHQDRLMMWEEFASGKAIKQRFGQEAGEITDEKTWETIVNNIALGMINLIAIIQPDVIIIGGGVGTHFDQFDDLLVKQLKKYETPLTPIPPLLQAQRPEEAVLYGCYELAKVTYGKSV